MAGINNNFYICVIKKNLERMFTFQEYLGFLLFLTIFTIGFWLMIFLVNFAIYWVCGASIEMYKEKRARKKMEAKESNL